MAGAKPSLDRYTSSVKSATGETGGSDDLLCITDEHSSPQSLMVLTVRAFSHCADGAHNQSWCLLLIVCTVNHGAECAHDQSWR